MERALRYNDGKSKWSLVDLNSLEPMVKVLMYGAEKYSPNNWRKGLKVTEIYESMFRHLIQLMGGEDIDSESGLPHIGHIQCNAMFMAYMLENREDMDDREPHLIAINTKT